MGARDRKLQIDNKVEKNMLSNMFFSSKIFTELFAHINNRL